MAVIHPSLFLVMERFPDRKDDLRQRYRTSESFQSLCQSYQKCNKALEHWSQSKHAEAPSRQREYSQLITELEQEIIQSLQETF
ncbi:MAG: hypothetical protein QNJ26_20100 [Desulfobacterales bacterium]|nr:hypothetical protein [Desulfobacterales bacterium]